MFALAGGAVAYTLGNAVLDGVAFTAKAPSNALAPRIKPGDRIVDLEGAARHACRAASSSPSNGVPRRGAGARPAAGGGGRPDRRPAGRVDRRHGGGRAVRLHAAAGHPQAGDAATEGCTFPDETPYLTAVTKAFGPVEVPAGTVFVMSDDRADLNDSRTYGPVPNGALAGRIIATLWPPSRIAVR